MTFAEIQAAVMANAFGAALLPSVKQWIIFRHRDLWDAEEWTFRYGSATVTFPTGQVAGGLPDDFRIAIALYDSQGNPVAPIRDARLFFNRYVESGSPGSGPPEAYTIFGGELLVGPNGDGSSGTLIYEKNKPVLSADGDETGLPDGCDLGLVFGARATGFVLTKVAEQAAVPEAEYAATIDSMRRNYLTQVRGDQAQMGADLPGLRQWR